MQFAFISRHAPTVGQIEMAKAEGIDLIHVGDADAFTVGNGFVHQKAADMDVTFEGVVVVHPAAALRLCSEFLVGVFANANRAPVGQPPQFEAVSFHIFDLRD